MHLTTRRLRWLTALLALLSLATAGLTQAAAAAAAGRDPLRPPRTAVPLPHVHGRVAIQSGPWEAVTTPPFEPGAMLLLTDGWVMMQRRYTPDWWVLKPDSTGNYTDGTWSEIAAMPAGYAPAYFASAVLPDGRVIVQGGEYNGTSDNGVWTAMGAIYNPVANSWSSVKPPNDRGWSIIGDSSGIVLPDGRFMLGDCCSAADALLNPATLTWSPTGANKADVNDEEGWTLLPNGKVLTIDINNLAAPQKAELYSPSTGTWAATGTLPDQVVNEEYAEIGPQVLMPDGDVLSVGATGHEAVYDSATGRWSTAPNLPVIGGQQYDSADGPGAVLSDGDVLIEASPGVYKTPAHFFVSNGATITQVADPPYASDLSSYDGYMLVLPTGQVLLNDYGILDIYTAGGTPQASWLPKVTSVPGTLVPGGSYRVTGTQLNGLTQGAYYGDDFQSATNYPLVRIENTESGHVFYARTFGMSSMSVTPGATSSAEFSLPPDLPSGAATLTVVASGFASAPVPVTVAVAPPRP